MENNEIRLPCQIGDKVYSFFTDTLRIREGTVDSFTITSKDKTVFVTYPGGVVQVYEFEDFGKTIFTDREAIIKVKNKKKQNVQASYELSYFTESDFHFDIDYIKEAISCASLPLDRTYDKQFGRENSTIGYYVFTLENEDVRALIKDLISLNKIFQTAVRVNWTHHWALSYIFEKFEKVNKVLSSLYNEIEEKGFTETVSSNELFGDDYVEVAFTVFKNEEKE